jgi:hypothetical protein
MQNPWMQLAVPMRIALITSLQPLNRALHRSKWLSSRLWQHQRRLGRRKLMTKSLWMLSCLVVLWATIQPARAQAGSSFISVALNLFSGPGIGATATLLLLIIVVRILLPANGKAIVGLNPIRRWLNKFLSTLIDAETQAYSLSRLQFYLWTAVAIWGYCYLFLSLLFVQHKPQFVDVPAGLPTVVAYSAGTTIGAAGITATKGSKGSGQIDPSFSDLITSGDIVLPERIQFLAWTLVGVGAYLFLLIEQAPTEIATLPTIPDGFLNLSAISSLGYLGGKLFRKPGPVISSIDSAQYDENSRLLTLVIKGQNLSRSARFLIKDTADKLTYLPGPDVTNLEVNLKDPSGGGAAAGGPAAEMGNQLEIKFATLTDNKWEAKNEQGEQVDYTLAMTNPDGQMAVWKFTGVTSV